MIQKIIAFCKRHKVLLLVLLAAIIIVLRKPDNLFHAQFVAEDGRYWYADAYNHGLKSLGWPQDGYLQTMSRLTGILALAVPFQYAPVVFVLLALIVQLLPIALLLSRKLEKLIPSFWGRAFLAFLYMIMPNTLGSYLFLTNSQFYLAITTALLIIMPNESGKFFIWIKRFATLLIGLSSMFPFLLLPVAFLKWWKTRQKNDLIILIILLLTALIQGYFFITAKSAGRLTGQITWSIFDLYSLLNRQYVWNLLLSPEGYTWLNSNFFIWKWIASLLSPFVFLMVIYTFLKIRFELKLYFIFAALVGLAGLLFPLGIDRNHLFYNLAHDTGGLRYWLLPMTVVLASLVYCSTLARIKVIRIGARVFVSLFFIGIIFSFKYPPTPDYHFTEWAMKFENLKSGEKIEIPMFPVPEYWVMKLTKH